MTLYPSQIDNNTSLPDVVDNATVIKAEVINKLKAAIIAVEKELGEQPSGIYTSVKARFNGLESALSNLPIISLASDLGNTLLHPHVVGLRGIPISSTAPLNNQILKYNGLAWEAATPAPFILPLELTLIAGSVSTNLTSPTIVTVREVDLSLYPATLPDGRARKISFFINLVSSDGGVVNAFLHNLTDNEIITNSAFATPVIVLLGDPVPVEFSAQLTAGVLNGNIKTNAIKQYSIKLWSDSNLTTVTCNNARLVITYV